MKRLCSIFLLGLICGCKTAMPPSVAVKTIPSVAKALPTSPQTITLTWWNYPPMQLPLQQEYTGIAESTNVSVPYPWPLVYFQPAVTNGIAVFPMTNLFAFFRAYNVMVATNQNVPVP